MDWTHNTFWVDQFPPGTYRDVQMRPGQKAVEGDDGCPYLNLCGFKPKTHTLRDLTGAGPLISLELVHSNIHNFEGISRLGALKRLEAHYCVKLGDAAGILEIKDSLEWLHINQATKFRLTDVAKLTDLKVLCLNKCGPLESLAFLHQMPHLLDFRFVGTNVLDGDLTPLLEHPSLVSVGFLDKRHYNLRAKEVKAHFADRAEEAKVYVHRGEFRIFRYRGMGNREA
jgi:hypothetical protein